VRERIEYYFRVPSAAVFTLHSYSKVLEYLFRVPTAGSLRVDCGGYKDGLVDDIAGNDSVSNDDGTSTTQYDSFLCFRGV
jgi:hypothetical protein